MAQSYRDLEIWQMARKLVVTVHKITLENLFATGSLKDKNLFEDLQRQYNVLGRKINNFLQRVISNHLAPKDQIGQQLSNDE